VPYDLIASACGYERQTYTIGVLAPLLPRGETPCDASAREPQFHLYFGPAKPEGVNEKNWIQTLKGRAFLVTIRLYGSGTEFYDQTWKPDDVVKVK
jgi:hypothetical protein